jgi:hypothetical protein
MSEINMGYGLLAINVYILYIIEKVKSRGTGKYKK